MNETTHFSNKLLFLKQLFTFYVIDDILLATYSSAPKIHICTTDVTYLST
ncbi:hypothetical protein Tsp_07188 [Trichinella spiralis]|nr:hypothetical protein Tsp_07188 [Trichinella spiralis]